MKVIVEVITFILLWYVPIRDQRPQETYSDTAYMFVSCISLSL